MFTITEAGINPLYENHPVYVVYREDGSYWGLTQTTSLDALVDGLAQELGGRYVAPPTAEELEAAEAAADADYDQHVNA